MKWWDARSGKPPPFDIHPFVNSLPHVLADLGVFVLPDSGNGSLDFLLRVVDDGAGAVDDFLVALDLGHDLLLHFQRWHRDRGLLEGASWQKT